MAVPVLESQIQKSILDYLKLKHILCFKHRNVGIFRKDTNAYIPLAFGEKGISDILGCLPANSKYPGRFIAIEVKRPKGKLSPDQIAFIQSVNNSGGIGFLADSLDTVIDTLRPLF